MMKNDEELAVTRRHRRVKMFKGTVSPRFTASSLTPLDLEFQPDLSHTKVEVCALVENGGMMKTQTTYVYLEPRPDKQTQELFIRGTGVRASTIWHDRYISRMAPQQIAQNRELAEGAVLEALAYCQDYWDVICAEKDADRLWLEAQGFFAETSRAQG